MNSKLIRITLAIAVGFSFIFKKPMGESISMATKPPVANSILADYGQQAGEELRKLLTTGQGDRATFVKVFTIENLNNNKFKESFGLALGETKQRFKDIFSIRIFPQLKKKDISPGFVWDEIERIMLIVRAGIPLEKLLASPGEGIRAHSEDDIAKNFLQGTPNPALALQVLGLIGFNSEPIGGEYTKTTDKHDIEKKRATVLRNIYASLIGLRYKAGIFGGDEGFRAYFEIEGDKDLFKVYYTKARKKGNLAELITDMEKYLNYYARKGSKSAEFIKALEEAEKEAKIKLIDNADARYPLGKPDEVLDKTMGIAMAIYFMINEGTWERGKGAFLKTLAMEIVQEKTADEARATIRSTPVLSTNELIEPSFDAQKIAKALAELEKPLKGSNRILYDRYVKSWLETKVLGKNPEYEIYDLSRLITHLSDAMRADKNLLEAEPAVIHSWLDNELNNKNLTEYMDKRLTFNAENIAKSILAGNGFSSNALGILMNGKGSIDNGIDVQDRIERERLRALEIILTGVGRLPEFQNKPEFQNIAIGDKLYDPEKEGNAVRIIQDFLYEQSKSGLLFIAFQSASMTPQNIEQNGAFTYHTATALAIWLSVKKGTWKKEEKAFKSPPIEL